MNGTSGCCSTSTIAACPPWTKTATSSRSSSLRPRTVTPPSTCWPHVAGSSQATLATEDVADEGWAARSQANLPAIRVGRDHRRPALGRAGSATARTICWSSKSSPRPGSAPDTTRPRDSACGRCRNSICVALACSTSARAPACWPWRPYAWVQPRRSASTTTRMRSSRPRTRCAATALRGRQAAVRMELRGLDDPALAPVGRACAPTSPVPCSASRARACRRCSCRVAAPCSAASPRTKPAGSATRSTPATSRRRYEEEFWVAYVLRRRAGHVPGVAHHRQRGQRHLLGPQRHRRQRPGLPPGVAAPPPLLQRSIRLRGRSQGTRPAAGTGTSTRVARRRRRLGEPQTACHADAAVSTSTSASGADAERFAGSPHARTAWPPRRRRAASARAPRAQRAPGRWCDSSSSARCRSAPRTVASRMTASIASPFSSAWATMIGAGGSGAARHVPRRR